MGLFSGHRCDPSPFPWPKRKLLNVGEDLSLHLGPILCFPDSPVGHLHAVEG